MAKNRYLEDIPYNQIKPLLNKMYDYFSSSKKDILSELTSKKEISKELEEKLHSAIKEFLSLK